MATITDLKLKITGSTTPLASDLEIRCTINWDRFDIRSNQPYTLITAVVGDDLNLADFATIHYGPDQVLDVSPSSEIRPSDRGGDPNEIYMRWTIRNKVLNEDKGGAPNFDEIKVVMTLAPVVAKPFGPIESNVVSLDIP